MAKAHWLIQVNVINQQGKKVGGEVNTTDVGISQM